MLFTPLLWLYYGMMVDKLHARRMVPDAGAVLGFNGVDFLA
jgi:hypothetical protein